jgi:hypothetical protein
MSPSISMLVTPVGSVGPQTVRAHNHRDGLSTDGYLVAPAAQLFADIYKGAGSPPGVRGLATNVANYNAWKYPGGGCPTYAGNRFHELESTDIRG